MSRAFLSVKNLPGNAVRLTSCRHSSLIRCSRFHPGEVPPMAAAALAVA
jgi:hypothetical protein